MAKITMGIIGVGSTLLGYNESKKQRESADRAARQQAQGVEEARQQTIESTNRAREAFSGLAPPSQEQQELQSQLDELIAQRDQIQSSLSKFPTGGSGPLSGLFGEAAEELKNKNQIRQMALAPAITSLENRIAGLQSEREAGAIDPRSDLMSGIKGQMGFAGDITPETTLSQAIQNQMGFAGSRGPQDILSGAVQDQLGLTQQGFSQAQQTINPLAEMAMPYMQEQQALLGLGGEEARQAALSRVSDPLAAEQERAMLRNNAALGGVGGNVLSALAEQTRARTEANIGNRLNQLSSAASPGLSALQNLSNLRLGQGQALGGIMGQAGRDVSGMEANRLSNLANISGQGGANLANMQANRLSNLANISGAAGQNLAAQETARRQAMANLELGQGSELAQLAQNLGTARAGGAAFQAQSQSPLMGGLTAGLNAFSGMGGFGAFGGGGGGGFSGPPQYSPGPQYNPVTGTTSSPLMNRSLF